MRNPATGAQTALYYIEESIVGTTPTTPTWKVLRYAGGIPALNRDSLQSEELDGSREIVNFRLGAKSATGDINVELSHLSHNDLLAAALQGTWEDDPNDASRRIVKVGGKVKTYSLLVQYNDLDPAGAKYDIIRGVEFTGFNLTIATNAIVKGTFSVIGRNYEADYSLPSGDKFASPTTSRPYTGMDGAILIDGSAVACATSIAPKLDNSASAEYCIGSNGVGYISYGRANNTYNISTVFSDYDLFKRYINETLTAIKFTLTLDSNFLEFTYPRCQLMSGSPNPQGEGTIVLPVEVQALKDATVGSSVVIACNK